MYRALNRGDLAALLEVEPWVLEAIHRPEFEKRSRVHNWRNYIPDVLQPVWDQLSEETRLVLIVLADGRASSEDWE